VERTTGTAWGIVTVYAVAHAAVDAGCAVLLWTSYENGALSASTAWSAFFVYNLLAFAVQPVVGLAVDRLRAGKGAAVLGAAATAAALALVAAAPPAIWPAVLLAGLGNAAFHVGGGVVALRAARGWAGPVGVFVAPGAAGLALGIAAGKAGSAWWPFAAALLALAAVLWLLPAPCFGAAPTASARRRAPGARPPASPSLATAGAGVIVLLLAVVGVRSFAGLTLDLPWKTDTALLVALTAAVVGGKAVGGLVADRLGWRPVVVGALLASLPLLALGAAHPAAGMTGVLMVNMTMPVTLAAVAAVLPRGSEGFAFGLTCLALFFGAVPSLLHLPVVATPTLLAALILPAAGALWVALGPPRAAATTPARPPEVAGAGRS
jgi:FSR family fosmidomycin resistance protein-like MFS transporter